MSVIQNVAVAGATGDLGAPILEALIQSKAFKVTVLTRESSDAKFPASVRVVRVDYTSVPGLTAAVKGQDAVISVLTTSAMELQLGLIEACIAAGVKRFIPSEFGSDCGNPLASKLPVYQPKIAVHKALQEQARAHPDFTYTLVRNGVFLDWSLNRNFIVNFASDTPSFYDGGDRPFSTTTLATIGQAVIGVLRHFEETKNRVVFVRDLVTTQRKVLTIAQRLAPERKWTPVTVNTADLAAASEEKYANGDFSLEASIGFLMRAIFAEGYGSVFDKVDNELLGIAGKTDADLEDLVRTALAGADK
ncbi:oxidoreductase CipA-like [Purpureocillium lavendulum]|uniref:Oxidoreductase CipA-like n=1 Tax=Purpureocillium lavendulum TaxID=1247861 RepID=A0AB34FH08_9HYPO|nr:oxidoreductase CipA-like [Purpureocillium lavendulum]